MIIDFHVHLFPPHIKADRTPYLAQDAEFRMLYENPRSRIATAEDLIASMDRAGIDVSVVQGFAWGSQDLCEETNRYILEAAACYPERLIPFCTVQPLAGEVALQEVIRCAQGPVKARGLGEMRLEGFASDAEVWTILKPFYEAARHHRQLLLLHASEPVGHTYPGKGRATPELLYRLVQMYPDWPIVLAHLGGGLPFYAAMPEVREALRNVYVDTAAWPLIYGPEVFPALTDLFGADKLLFGTDYPLLDQRRVLQQTKALPLPEEALKQILGDNAVRLLNLSAEGQG